MAILENTTERYKRAYMYHVMVKEKEIIVCNSWDDLKENKKEGYELYAGSSSEKTAFEMAESLKEEKRG